MIRYTVPFDTFFFFTPNDIFKFFKFIITEMITYHQNQQGKLSLQSIAFQKVDVDQNRKSSSYTDLHISRNAIHQTYKTLNIIISKIILF